MKLFGLLITSVLSIFGIFSLLVWSFANLSFNWEDFIIYLVVAAVAYLCVRLVGGSLNKSFTQLIMAYVEGKLPDFEINKGQLRVFGFLLITMLPFLVFLMLFALYAAITFGFYGLVLVLNLPRVPIALIIGLALVVFGTAWAVLLGFWRLIFPKRSMTLGIEIKKADQKSLWDLLNGVAKDVGTKPVDKVILKPDTGIGVYQEGNIFARLSGKGARILEIGTASIHDLKLDEFKAILAHEYGHFSHRDTQWGAFTYQMGTSLQEALRSTPGPVQKGSNGYIALVMALNPAYWLLFIYVLLYFKITNGFSRVREVMADIRSVRLYGSKAFSDGLLQVATNDYVFSNVVEAKFVPDLLKEGKTIANIPKFLNLINKDNNQIPDLEKAILEERESTSVYDSHPSLPHRLQYAKQLNIDKPIGKQTTESVFENWEKLSEEVTDLYNARLMTILAHLPKEEPKSETEAEPKK
jgi:Zn-dependent protease with chaperone function